MNLPAGFEEKMRCLLGDEMEAYLACYDEPRYYGLRVNTSKISVEEFQKICPFEITPVPWIENGFYYDGETVSPARHPYYFAGLYYLQEPSAMTPANRLPIEPGDKVLDVCAAPGGKATELGARLLGDGLLVANDISSSRAKGLLKNIEVFGIGNVLVLSEEPGRLIQYFPEYFDKILIDAPCSGEGMFRKEHKMVKAWEEHGPEYFCNIQRSIILGAAQMLKPGGLLLYSTCTFDGRENEQIISLLREQNPKFQILEIAPYEGFTPGMPGLAQHPDEELKKTVRIFPHRMKGEGHYVALLKKETEDLGQESREMIKAGSVKTGGGAKIPEPLAEFLRDVSWEIDGRRLDIRKERIYYMPLDLPDVRGIRFLRTGLLLGELKKNRFEPSQALAMCLRKTEYARCLDFPAEDARVLRYLKGETLDVEELVSAKEKGWRLVCVDGFPLGWGKLGGGVLKNKYLPGWRLC
ncbi:MAG: RsmF rRNA methyltransferase first C-terminal domain-containing protein [Lachnospiraceae bacterium]